MAGLLPVILAKALVEVALLLLLGRGVLYLLLAGDPARRAGNFVYRLFELGTRPFFVPVRARPAHAPEALARHWRRTRLFTIALLGVWVLATFGVGFFARDLQKVRFFGWPLSYYMGAQGALIVFLLIIGGYALVMRKLDREALGDEAAADRDGEP